MQLESLKIRKAQKEVRLWVHPEGQVIGALFVSEQSEAHQGQEQPLEVLNRANPFVVVKRRKPDELRFYNRASIIRVSYEENEPVHTHKDTTVISCELHMMDGSVLSGQIRETLPADYSRLFDYLNADGNPFLRLVTVEETLLVNKSYINHVRQTD
ncbi:MAG TPA: hypothetical protein ENJ01_07460 [Gammaproteobacteria bacterium]|nr:hypothetical protein [Gammaproteobacteria bacterium]